MANCVVHWLYDETCICPWRHGYVGISRQFRHRLAQHKKSLRAKFAHQILFVGSLTECRELEFKLRPDFNVGWNVNPGGGKTHGPRIRAAMIGRRITWGDKIAKTLTGHTRTMESRRKQGASLKGIRKSPEHRNKMRLAALARYSKPGEKERTAVSVRLALKGINRWMRHYRKHGQTDFEF